MPLIKNITFNCFITINNIIVHIGIKTLFIKNEHKILMIK